MDIHPFAFVSSEVILIKTLNTNQKGYHELETESRGFSIIYGENVIHDLL